MNEIRRIPIGKWLRRISYTLLLFPTFLIADECSRPSLLSLGAGTFDTLRPRERMLQFQAEYKWSASWHGVQPIASLMFSEKGSAYFCFGACYDIYLGPYIVLEPSFAPGIYIKGHGKELGFPLEFRSSLSLAAEFCNCHRLGVQFYHISNASLGFKNPGEESLVIFYSFAIW